MVSIRQELEKTRQTFPDQYYRGLVFIALNYAQNGFPTEALNQIHAIPLSYFQGPSQKQMEESPEFFQVATKLYSLIQEAGLEPFEYTNLMKPAEA